MSKDSSGNYHQRLHALDLATGTEQSSSPVEIQATYGNVTFDPKQHLERSALLLLNGVVYVSFASHCDQDPYHGWIMGYDQNTLQQVSVFNITPNGSEGGIWMSGGGLAADQSGNIHLMDGNGTFDTTLDANGFPTNQDFGNAFVKLSTAGGSLKVVDYFNMSNQAAENCCDLELGSGGPLVLPDLKDSSGTVHHLAMGAGKDKIIYVVGRDNMGKFHSGGDQIYQEISGALAGQSYSTPALFNNTIYYAAGGDQLKAFAISNAKLGTSPSSQSAATFPKFGDSPAVSANGTSNGIVWAVANATPGILYAFDAGDLSHELYNSSQAGTRDQFNNRRFNTPMIANGTVLIDDADGVHVFGLLARNTAMAPVVRFGVNPTSGGAPLTVTASTQVLLIQTLAAVLFLHGLILAMER